jgi:SAM-dependent methyltransferase
MPLLNLGKIEITPNASNALTLNNLQPADILNHHQFGEAKTGSAFYLVENPARPDRATASKYRLKNGIELWVVTAEDGSHTRMYLSGEFQTFEVGLQEGYAIWSSSYDNEDNALILLEEPFVESIINSLSITEALDVGTGTGRHAIKLAKSGAKVTAIDASPEMLAVARQKANRESVKINFQLASLNDGLPFEGEKFDFVISGLMLCHIPDLKQALREFQRVLKPDGTLLITDFHPDAVERGWRTQFNQWDRGYLLPKLPHTRHDYEEAVRGAGFKVINLLDIPLREVPAGFIPETLLRGNEDMLFCLVIQAQK